MYQPSLSTGNPYNRWMKRNSGGTTGSSTVAGMQNFHLTGQRPQALVGHETNYPYAVGGFPTTKFGGGFNRNRLQNALSSSSRNRYFQYQFEIPDSESNSRMLQGIQGGRFTGMESQQQPQYSVNRFYMNSNGLPQSFKPHGFNQGNPHIQ